MSLSTLSLGTVMRLIQSIFFEQMMWPSISPRLSLVDSGFLGIIGSQLCVGIIKREDEGLIVSISV